MELIDILPDWLNEVIEENFIFEYISEIRIRISKPITICYKGRYVQLSKTNYNNFSVNGSKELIDYVIMIATKRSMYFHINQIKNGFISTESGIRIGICGNVVYQNGEVSSINNISSINIRIAHEINNCTEKIMRFIIQNGIIKNTLIISPPGAGKTTFVRDIIKNLSKTKEIENILVVDERYEIAGENRRFDLGENADIISGSTKEFAFNEGIKTMNPTVIVTDEVSSESDINALINAKNSGVKIIATAHAEGIADLKTKEYLKKMIAEKYFDRIIILSKRLGAGTIEGVFDESLRGIYIPYIS